MKTTQADYYCKLAPLFCALALSTQAHADVISDWNLTAITAIKTAGIAPLPGTRALAMTHVAQFDAVNAVAGGYAPYAVTLSAPQASAEAAAAQAAHDVLVSLFPPQTAILDAALAASLAVVPDDRAKTDGLALGHTVAAAVIALRASDGSTAVVPYVPGSGPGVWIPTPPAFAPALLPQWRYVTPWTMTVPEQFRPGPPPLLTSDLYTRDFNEIKALGRVDSAARPPEQTDTALFHFEAPAFTLGNATRAAVASHPLRLVDSARLFALVNMGMADALIAVWDAVHENDV